MKWVRLRTPFKGPTLKNRYILLDVFKLSVNITHLVASFGLLKIRRVILDASKGMQCITQALN